MASAALARGRWPARIGAAPWRKIGHLPEDVVALVDAHLLDVGGTYGDLEAILVLDGLAIGWWRLSKTNGPNRPLAAAVVLDAAEALVHGVAVRAPEHLANDEFATEVTDLLVRYLAKGRREVRARPSQRRA